MSSEAAPAAAIVAQAARVLGRLGLTQAALGHVSCRVGPDRMLIKGKGEDEVGLRFTESADVVEVDFSGDKRGGAGGLRPPSESFIHTWIYKLEADVNSVIHLHPRHAVLLTICDKEIRPIYGAFGGGARMAIEGVRTYQRSVRILDDERGEDFARFLGGRQAALMRGHGITVTGDSVEDAAVRAIELEELATMTYQAYLLGEPRPISDEDIAELAGSPRATGRGSPGGRAGIRSKWRYYCRLVGEEPLPWAE